MPHSRWWPWQRSGAPHSAGHIPFIDQVAAVHTQPTDESGNPVAGVLHVGSLIDQEWWSQLSGPPPPDVPRGAAPREPAPVRMARTR